MALYGLPLTFLYSNAFKGVEVSCQNIPSPVLMTCLLCLEAIFWTGSGLSYCWHIISECSRVFFEVNMTLVELVVLHWFIKGQTHSGILRGAK